MATRRGSGASETRRIGRGGTSSCCALPPSADTGQDVKQTQQLRPARAPQLEQQPAAQREDNHHGLEER